MGSLAAHRLACVLGPAAIPRSLLGGPGALLLVRELLGPSWRTPFPLPDVIKEVLDFQRPAAGGGTAVESPIAQICDCGQHGVLLTFSAWGPGGPGAPSLPGNPGGPYINKGEGGNERGSEGGVSPSFFLLCVLHCC